MSRDELVNKVTDKWTDNIYSDIVDVLKHIHLNSKWKMKQALLMM